MNLTYNGVTLNILTIDQASRETVFTPDGADVLYTKWDIKVTAVYAPGTTVPELSGTSLTFRNGEVRAAAEGDRAGLTDTSKPWGADGAPQIVVPTGSGITLPGIEAPLLTDRELRVRLSVPRKLLRIWGWNPNTNEEIDWLRSPREGLTCDAKNGPFVRAQMVSGIAGEGVSMAVGLEIQTWEPPCPEGYDRLILGHRWQMTHEWDIDYYLTRNVVGHIWFHTGLLKKYGYKHDAVVQQLFHPIPRGFQRALGPVSLCPDGSTVQYSYSDTDQRFVFVPGESGGTRIELTERTSYVAPGRAVGVNDLLNNTGLTGLPRDLIATALNWAKKRDEDQRLGVGGLF